MGLETLVTILAVAVLELGAAGLGRVRGLAAAVRAAEIPATKLLKANSRT